MKKILKNVKFRFFDPTQTKDMLKANLNVSPKVTSLIFLPTVLLIDMSDCFLFIRFYFFGFSFQTKQFNPETFAMEGCFTE